MVYPKPHSAAQIGGEQSQIETEKMLAFRQSLRLSVCLSVCTEPSLVSSPPHRSVFILRRLLSHHVLSRHHRQLHSSEAQEGDP